MHGAITMEERLEAAVGGRQRLHVVALLAAVLGLQNADNATVGAVAAPLEAALHISTTELGLLSTVTIAVGAVATLPLGVLVDRMPRVRLLTVAIVVWSVAMVVCALAQSYLMLLLTRLALGAVVATASPAVASLTGDLFPAATRGRIYGYILSGELLGTGAGLFIAGSLAGVSSWRVSFAVLAAPGVALAIALPRLLPEPHRGGAAQAEDGAGREPAGGGVGVEVGQVVEAVGLAPHPEQVLTADPRDVSLREATRLVLRVRTNVALVIASALGYFFFSGLQTFGVELLRGRFGLGQTTASTLLVVVGAGAVLGTVTSGRLADRRLAAGHVAARPVVAGVAFVAAAALFVPGLLLPALVTALPLVMLGAIAYGATNPPLDAARLDVVQHHLWGRAEAVRTALRSLFEASAPLVFGFVAAQLGHGRGGFANAGGGVRSGAVAAAAASGLDRTFLVMLLLVGLAGGVLLVVARRTYGRDVATTVTSERHTAHR
jgi:predicted MFS family arabinose efflux permease